MPDKNKFVLMAEIRVYKKNTEIFYGTTKEVWQLSKRGHVVTVVEYERQGERVASLKK